MRLGALLFLLYAYACAADDVEVYDEEPAVDDDESEVIDESIRRSVDALLRFPLQRDEIKHRITVSDGDKDTGFLELSGREEVADAAYAFGLIKGAPRRGTRQLQEAVCRGQGLVKGALRPPCTRRSALILDRDVLDPRDENMTQKLPGRLEVWEGQSPLDAVGGLVRAANLHTTIDVEWFAPALVDALCTDLAHPELFACGEHELLGHHKHISRVVPINLGGEKGVIGDLVLHDYEEAADAIYNFSQYHDEVTAFGRRQLLQNLCGKDAKKYQYKCSRQQALVFKSAPVRSVNGTVALLDATPALLQVWEGEEPADAVKAFCDQVGFSDDDAKRLIREVCGEYPVKLLPRRSPLTNCQRLSWVLEVMPVRGPFGPGGRMAHVGDLPIIEGEEGHDLAWAFAADRGCEGCPFYKQLAATLCAKPRVTCSRRKARVWKAFVDVATQEALAWPEPLEDAFIEVLEGDQVVDGVRELWFSRNVTNTTELHTDNARFKRRALTALSCNPEYGHADAKLCARAEEIVARADVERPGATKTLQFNSTLPRKHDDRDCGDALSRRADYDDLLMDRIKACAPPPPKKLDKDAWRRRKRMRRDEAEREADKAREDVEKRFLDDVEGIESNATNATEPEKKNASAPADPEACEAATKAVESVSLHKIQLLIEAACVPTVYDFGIKGWAGNSNLQVLGAHNDSEADRRELFQGMKLRRVDGVLIDSLTDYKEALKRKAAEAFQQKTRVNMSLEFLVVDENDRFLTGGQKGEGAGPISVYEHETASDAVYRQAHLNELIQPNYTALGVQKRFLVTFWGVETSFGRYLGSFNVPQALVTLAYDGRRSDYFRKELFNALTILEQGHITVSSMKGSWAGAMGQSQFMPSSFINYAVDWDGDGKRDIWDTKADVFASSANYLAKAGWRDDITWGRAVALPTGGQIDGKPALEFAEAKIKMPLGDWARAGVTSVDGSALPARQLQARLVMPAGDTSPAYLVYSNFDAILAWNRSNYYALAIGILSDTLR